MKIATKISSVLFLLVCLQLSTISHAFSSIAVVPDHPVDTIFAAWNFPEQKKADLFALDGCRSAAKKSGLSKIISKCAVVHRQKNPGAGAISCGKNGCTMSSGSETEQVAAQSAYDLCEKKYGECQSTNLTSWWDDAGYKKKLVKNVPPAKSCGAPPGRTVRSSSRCSNGDCTRTFENGCTVRFQAPYCHDPITGKWEWKPDGC